MKASKIQWSSCVLIAVGCIAMLLEWLRGMDMPNQTFAGIRQDVIGIVLSRSGQVLIMICLIVWHLTLLWIKTESQHDAHSQRRRWPDVMTTGDACKTLLVFFVVVAYINGWMDIEQPGRLSELLLGIDQSTNLLVLLAGIIVSQISGMLLRTGEKDGFAFRYFTLAFLVVFLTATSLARFHIPHTYMYRSQARWTGLWVNPNTFGVLMGVGMVTAVGLIFLTIQAGRFKTAKLVFYGTAAVLMSIGLLHSYSRGAWMGFTCGLFYLGFRLMGAPSITQPNAVRWIRRNTVCVFVMACSLALVAFWQFQDTDHRLARRAFSVGNANDFSWRNRVAAYEGAMQMMAEEPWFGTGWNKPESTYTQYYRSVDVDGGMAIQLNDLFTLGTTFGLPA